MADRSTDTASENRQTEALPEEPKKSKKWLIIFLGLIVLVGGGIGAVIFFAPGLIPDSLKFGGSKGETQEEKKPAAKKLQGHIYSMDPFIVNLADANPSRYLKIKLSLESKEPKANEEYDKRLPQLRDTVLTILSSKTFKEVSDSEGKVKLREEIISRVNERLGSFQVKNVRSTVWIIFTELIYSFRHNFIYIII